MTNTELMKKIVVEAFYYVKAYFINYLFPIIKEAFEETKNYFIEAVWSKMKEHLNEHLEMGIQEANTFFASSSYEEKEKIVIDYIFEHIHLPVLLRPSKIIAKKVLKKKIREYIADKLDKLQKLDKII